MNNQKGFTLYELIVVVGVAAAFSTGAYIIYLLITALQKYAG